MLYAYGAFLFRVRRNYTAAEPLLERGCLVSPGSVDLQLLFAWSLRRPARNDFYG